ncbi:polyisoprenoid-binding protein YceI [Aquimarina sp. MAR_2010_214]|uniref:YceI family protein n=1 Tax=Aquimarina sp. MAR_2010_214 TaxID=1250026 RepID=UPI000C6FD7D6|nr:YceI family protein [Aquimarina sp. MAR_2010_214]PKV51926.1 polyisoprenoid-binding protein YceI [Aquimarina sp. MAR_2010_214]
MKKLAIVIAFIATTYSFAQKTTWNVDASHSKVSFSVSHLVISEVDGNFNSFNGSFISNKDDFSDAKITFDIDANSINTENAKRDGHLKSEDFFYVEKYPKITFKSTSFKKKSKNKYQLKGNLTMRGITKKVTLDVSHGGIIANDGFGNTKAGFKATGTINRTDFGVAWNAKTEHGGMVVGEDIEITIKLELVKKDPNVN